MDTRVDLSSGSAAYAYKVEEWSNRPQWNRDANDLFELLPKEGRVMDVGCNMGKMLQLFHTRNPYLFLYGVDVNPDALVHAKERVPSAEFGTSVLGTAHKYMMDAVVCNHSLMQMADPALMLHKMFQVLRPGGKIIVTSHNRWNKLLWAFPNMFNGYKPDAQNTWDHSLYKLTFFMEQVGFKTRWAEFRSANWFLNHVTPFLSEHVWYLGHKPYEEVRETNSIEARVTPRWAEA